MCAEVVVKDLPFIYATFVSYQRSKVKQRERVALFTLQGIRSREAALQAVGKVIGIVNPASGKTIFGRVTCPHGNSGAVRARFFRNLPPQLLGNHARLFFRDPENLGNRATPKDERLRALKK
ncbi:Ribosomal protein L35a [Giardia muris]|uniref:Ribosomal protein L35a n=1 Tax=Giardia muris TaxID=5742 RepID=A0A4Z1SWC2_GIAMU|nr:Ribosomal protein L35a [Giardia muris]|eukprot:TNJ27838.1 Ribosomal protein L35a [Giardia muris]